MALIPLLFGIGCLYGSIYFAKIYSKNNKYQKLYDNAEDEPFVYVNKKHSNTYDFDERHDTYSIEYKPAAQHPFKVTARKPISRREYLNKQLIKETCNGRIINVDGQYLAYVYPPKQDNVGYLIMIVFFLLFGGLFIFAGFAG